MLRHFIRKIYYMLRRIWILLTIKDVKIGWGAVLHNNTWLGGCNKIGEGTIFGGEIGRYSYVGANCNLVCRIGKYCSVSNNVILIAATHPIRKYVSTNPVFYSLRKQCGKTFADRQKFPEFEKLDNEKYALIMGNDVLVGIGVTFLGAVRVGDGAVIGANSTVTKDVEPYSIVAGSPAKVIGKRFTDEQIEFLLKFKWWDKDEEWIIENYEKFDDIENFMKLYGGQVCVLLCHTYLCLKEQSTHIIMRSIPMGTAHSPPRDL